MKRYVIGDIHGNYKGLIQVLKKCEFDYEEDLLITIGDIVDGWSDTYECIEELLKIKNRIDIRGNHDEVFQTWLRTTQHPFNWKQGGEGVLKSYLRRINKEHLIERHVDIWNNVDYGYRTSLNVDDIPQSHKDFFNHQIDYYVLENKCFVHGGFNREYTIDEQHASVLWWDRDLWLYAQSCTKNQKLATADDFDQIFIGHTHCDGGKNPECLPLTKGGITNIDTGSGWSGKLTLMNIDNIKEYYQSERVRELYPDEKGR